MITTVAGGGTRGYTGDNGPAAKAQLNLGVLCNIATDPTGSLYIVDWLGGRKDLERRYYDGRGFAEFGCSGGKHACS